MPDRRGSRFILEVLFLVGLAVALTLAKLRPLEIAGVMLLGWLIVAILEWAAWRGEPHYGSGLPPRYYVPSVEPAAGPAARAGSGRSTRMPSRTRRRPGSPRRRCGPRCSGPTRSRPGCSASGRTWCRRRESSGVAGPSEADADPWTVVALPAAPLGEPEPERRSALSASRRPSRSATRSPSRLTAIAPARPAPGDRAHSLDPLADPPPRRRFGRGGSDAPPAIEVSARPAGVRALPGRSSPRD